MPDGVEAATPAEELRTAAKAMRERAEAVTFPGPWSASMPAVRNLGVSALGGREKVADCAWNDAGHIASWHPGVALKFAFLLEAVSLVVDGTTAGEVSELPVACRAAIEAARAFLGTSPEDPGGWDDWDNANPEGE
jgi:hypothetical protein